jgi:hypothetical protein
MFDRITNPETNRKVRLDTRLGRRVLKEYLNRYQQMGGADIMGDSVESGNKVRLVKDGEHNPDQSNQYVVKEVNSDIDCNFKNSKGEVQPCTFMEIVNTDDLRDGKLNEADSIQTYFPDHQPGDLEDMDDNHFNATQYKGILVHERNHQKLKKHQKKKGASKVASRNRDTQQGGYY